MSFFQLDVDPTLEDVWFLGEPLTKDGEELDARIFINGIPYTGKPPYRVPVSKPGRSVQFNFAAFDMPVISDVIFTILHQICPDEFESFPVVIDSFDRGFSILNVVSVCKCIDERRSYIMRWGPEDGRPDKVGQYRMVTDLTIKKSMAQGRNIFRLEGWEIALIVSQAVKTQVETLSETGLVFTPVC